jgi:hypothetical protein
MAKSLGRPFADSKSYTATVYKTTKIQAIYQQLTKNTKNISQCRRSRTTMKSNVNVTKKPAPCQHYTSLLMCQHFHSKYIHSRQGYTYICRLAHESPHTYSKPSHIYGEPAGRLIGNKLFCNKKSYSYVFHRARICLTKLDR